MIFYLVCVLTMGYLHYLYIKQNKLPKQSKIGERAIAWLESDIDAWIDERLARME